MISLPILKNYSGGIREIMKKLSLIIISVLSLTLAGCASSGHHEDIYHNYGNAGKNFSANLVTPTISNAMDDGDKSRFMQLLTTTGPHQATTWKNSYNGNLYEFTSLNIFVDDQGKPCRQYKMRVLIDGEESLLPQMTACRYQDTSWQPQG